MIWLILACAIQILGFGFTLTRLAYDEWQASRVSGTLPAAMENCRGETECVRIAATT